jgi:hypothetical protein
VEEELRRREEAERQRQEEERRRREDEKRREREEEERKQREQEEEERKRQEREQLRQQEEEWQRRRVIEVEDPQSRPPSYTSVAATSSQPENKTMDVEMATPSIRRHPHLALLTPRVDNLDYRCAPIWTVYVKMFD